MKRFQYGVCEWSLKARGSKLCEMAAKSGLECLQLGVGDEIFKGQGLMNERNVDEYKEACEKYGLWIESISPQFVDKYSFTMPKNADEEELVIALIEKTIDLCEVFGCSSYLLPVLCKNDIVDENTFKRAVDFIKKFSDRAAEKGIQTTLELNQSVQQVYKLLEAINNPKVKVFFDSQNLYALDRTSMSAYFTELSDIIAGVHLKDGIGSALSESLLGEGTSGFFKTATAIKQSPYRGSLIIESVYSNLGASNESEEFDLLKKDANTLISVFDRNAYYWQKG